VQFTAAFCRSCSYYSGPIPFATGEVTEVQPFSPYGRTRVLKTERAIVTVKWDKNYFGEVPARAANTNLKRVEERED